MSDDPKSEVEALLHLTSIVVGLVLISLCITIGLFLGAAFGMAAFTLICTGVACVLARLTILKMREIRDAKKIKGD